MSSTDLVFIPASSNYPSFTLLVGALDLYGCPGTSAVCTLCACAITTDPRQRGGEWNVGWGPAWSCWSCYLPAQGPVWSYGFSCADSTEREDSIRFCLLSYLLIKWLPVELLASLWPRHIYHEAAHVYFLHANDCLLENFPFTHASYMLHGIEAANGLILLLCVHGW